MVAAALDSLQGFSLTLAGCKALLEHGVELNIVRDVHPDALVEGLAGLRRGLGRPPKP
jgi:hypothetical protein